MIAMSVLHNIDESIENWMQSDSLDILHDLHSEFNVGYGMMLETDRGNNGHVFEVFSAVL